MKNLFKTAFILLLLNYACTNNDPMHKHFPTNVILDTDMGPDFDDAGALATLLELANRGEAKVLGTVTNNSNYQSATIIDIINRYYGMGDIPIGIAYDSLAKIRTSSNDWNRVFTEKYGSEITKKTDVTNAITVYRKLLSNVPDSSVKIISIGFLNNLRSLLLSSPDEFSDLNGFELVKRKVSQLVCMGGKYPEGREYNFYADPISTKYVIENWPGEIIFSGYEIGNPIMTGNLLVKAGAKNNPVRDIYEYCLKNWQDKEHPEGRSSYDQTAVLAAVRDPNLYWSLMPGKNNIQDNGSNYWTESGSQHYYLIQKSPLDSLKAIIEELMVK